MNCSQCGEGIPPSTHKMFAMHYFCSEQCVAQYKADAGGQPVVEKVDHPSHYGGADNPYEHIKVAAAWFSGEMMSGYHLGNATKYIARAGKKTASPLEDLRKAAWYLQAEITRLEKTQQQEVTTSHGTQSQPSSNK